MGAGAYVVSVKAPRPTSVLLLALLTTRAAGLSHNSPLVDYRIDSIIKIYDRFDNNFKCIYQKPG